MKRKTPSYSWKDYEKKITCPSTSLPSPASKPNAKTTCLKTLANSITEYLATIIDLYRGKRSNHTVTNKKKKEGIHLKNPAKQLELYKQNPATGGNGGGMGVRQKEKQDTGLFNCASHTNTPHPCFPLSPVISCSEHWAHFLSPLPSKLPLKKFSRFVTGTFANFSSWS